MTEYSKTIAKLAEEKTNQIYFNSCDSHALIVLKNLVKNAKISVKTICGNMCSEVSNDEEYLDIVDQFLKEDRERKFQIIFDDFNENFFDKKISKVFERYSSQVQIKKFKDSRTRVQYDNSAIHLTVTDSLSFRLETNIDKKMAWGNFGDPVKAPIFSEAFDTLFSSDKCVDVTKS